MGINEDVDIFSVITDELSSLLKYTNPEANKEEAYRAGVTAGYTRDAIEASSSSVEKNESIYADGLMVGLGIESKDEYDQIMEASAKRQKQQSRSLRSMIKTMNFGVEYGMGLNQIRDHIVGYSKDDCNNVLNIQKALKERGEENA